MSMAIMAIACLAGCSSKRSESRKRNPDVVAPAPPVPSPQAAATSVPLSVNGQPASGASAPGGSASAASLPPASLPPASLPPERLVAARPVAPEVCADCHPDQVEGYLKSGMARSLYRPKGRAPIEDFTKATITNPPFAYRAFIDADGRWWQEETVTGKSGYARRVEVQYIVGSGNHTRSYIGRVEGELIELPLTWYVKRALWDMSPGYKGGGNQRFDRPIKPECLFCHTGLTPLKPQTVAGYMEPLLEGIGCDRCHGDGHAHVAQRAAGKGPPPGQPDPSIFNPKRQSPAIQLRVCQQCHLQGEARVLMQGRRWDTYDPSTPLADFLSIFEYAETGGDTFSIASHGQRMAMSACFKESAGTLSCTTCHDPHSPESARASKAACVGCHSPADHKPAGAVAAKACKSPDHATQSCAKCHLRKAGTSDIPHVTFTDHWIRIRPEAPVGEPPFVLGLTDRLAGDRTTPSTAKALNREAIAHARLWRLHGRDAHLFKALTLLENAVRADESDARVWTELAKVQSGLGNLPAALGAMMKATQIEPGHPIHLTDLAELFEAAGQINEAEATLRAALATDPTSRIAWGNLANVLQKMGRFPDAEQAYAKADALAPHLALTAVNRGYGFLTQSKPVEARTWFMQAIKRDPGYPRGYFAMGTLAMQTQEWAKADGWFDEALKISPGFVDALWLKGRVAEQRGDLPGARRSFNTMIEVAPQAVNGYLDLAALEGRLKNAEARKRILMKGLMALPNHPALQQALRPTPAAP
ncbi:MAG: tetratricopeptide (TPR) repeat protein [Bradymonadia bacterium]|jgi:tetratricopeptide (TPR) repeat protein